MSRSAVMPTVLLGLLCVGCAASHPQVSAPMPDDVAWSAPVATSSPRVTPPVPVSWGLDDRPRAPHERVLVYEEGLESPVDVPLQFPLTLILKPGELIESLVFPSIEVKDDRPVWTIKDGSMGQGATRAPVVFIEGTEPGRQIGLTITTTQRIYHLAVRAVGKRSYRVVRWIYPADALAVPVVAPRIFPDPDVPRRYHVGYDIAPSSPRPHWTPTSVVFDGQRTYLLFPRNLAVMNAPLVRLIGPNGPEVVNAHQHGSVVWIDALVDRAELRLGTGEHAETVLITRGVLRLIDCPGEVHCPRFPEESTPARVQGAQR